MKKQSRRSPSRLLLVGITLVLTGVVVADVQVNTYTTSFQREPSVSAEDNGDFVVVWQSHGSSETDSSSNSIHGQRYSSDGAPTGSQFQVNSYTTDDQRYSAVATDADGDFVVVWQSFGSSGTDSANNSIQGQRYDSDGTPLGGQFQVNSYTTDEQRFPEVAMDADGDFVVVWQSSGSGGTDSSNNSIQGQRFDSGGAPAGSQFQINSYTTAEQQRPVVATDADGDLIVVWQSDGSTGTDSSSFSILGQRYASDGTLIGGEFQVNSYTTSVQRYPAIDTDSSGDFVVVWQSHGSSGTDSFYLSIQGQRFAADGTLLGIQFQVNSYTDHHQTRPAVAMDVFADEGDFVVAWQSNGSNGTDSANYSVQGQRFASDGTVSGGEFQVNAYTTGMQRHPVVVTDGDGDFVVVWQSYGSSGTDSSGYSSLKSDPGLVPVELISFGIE